MKFPDKFSNETKRVLSLWYDIIQKRHQDNEDYSEPLLVIEYNQQGLIDRNITEQDVGNVIRGTPGYNNIPFLNLTHQPPQSDAVFAFNQLQTMDDAINQLFLNFSNYRTGQQDASLGRVYVIEFRRAHTFEVSERLNVFD
ncbi:hypothetical protein RclHR1_04790010 [Rhizophagus clarus]|uniref:Uncharacterized protein n=1 Tax=Rhizophagus clarus TaxID=94130 RepID=A0A2Z6RKR3_9GLOM|nr:hypothetical protein RclHR1_04790010 [Rhizophagus clarus]GES95887.1 hypothetical protein GLOIN_2v1788452 [Rhizophagus clarus]